MLPQYTILWISKYLNIMYYVSQDFKRYLMLLQPFMPEDCRARYYENDMQVSSVSKAMCNVH